MSLHAGRLSTIHHWIRRVEFTCSALLLAALALGGLSISSRLTEVALLVAFLIPGFLGLVALAGVGVDLFDMYSTWKRVESQRRRLMPVAGKLVVTAVTGVLAVVTLFWVVQTILVLTVVDTGGGVIFSHLFFMFTGTLLAGVIVLRTVGKQFVYGRIAPPDDHP